MAFRWTMIGDAGPKGAAEGRLFVKCLTGEV